ncbi:MAG: response regulator [Actinomycetota bacterium]
MICDDHKLFLDSLADYLAQRGYSIAAAVVRPSSAIEIIQSSKVDLCLLDLTFPEESGVEAISKMKAASDGIKIVVLSGSGDPALFNSALEAGADCVISKAEPAARIVEAIEQTLAGQSALNSQFSVPGGKASEKDWPGYMAQFLTAQERKVLAQLVNGQGTQEIARLMGLSYATVRTHIQSVLVKLGVHSRVEAVAFAVRHSLIDPQNPES